MKKIYLFLSLLLCGLLIGNVNTMNAAEFSVANFEELLLDGDINPPGCFGYSDPGDAIVFPIEKDHQIIIASEYWGNFSSEQQVSSVTFETAKPTSSYPAYINNKFVVKIYEGTALNGKLMESGSSNLIDKYRGTLVYEQEYTQKAYGVQNVELKTPYALKDSTFFCIAIEAKDNTLFKKIRVRNGNVVAADDYENYVMGANYLYMYTKSGKSSGEVMDFIFLNGVGLKANAGSVIPYAENYMLTFCVSPSIAPSVTPSALTFEKEGGEQSFEVFAAAKEKTGWTATTDADWLTLSAVEGPGAGSKTMVAVTAEANSTGKMRNATIAITQGSKIQTVKVIQENYSSPGMYGTAALKTTTGIEENASIIICPEQFGTYKGGQKISAVKFYAYDPAETKSFQEYTNKDVTIKIYEGSAKNADFETAGRTKKVEECLGTLVKSFPYTIEKYGEQTINFDDKDQYEIRDGVSFWIALDFPGKTVVVYEAEVRDTLESYTTLTAYKASNHKYMVTTLSSGVLYLQDAYTGSKVSTGGTKLSNKNFYFQFQLANPTDATRKCDIVAKLYDYSVGSLKTLPTPIALSATGDLAKIAPRFMNNGPDTVILSNFDFTISLGDANVYHYNVNYSSINPSATGNYKISSVSDVTYTAEQMNDLMLYGEFDMKLSIDYNGYDPDLSNNTFVAKVNRERPTFDISLAADSTFLDGVTLKGTGQYKLGEEYAISVEPAPGVSFLGWFTPEGYEISKDLICSFIATESRTFVAKYEPIIYAVKVTANPDTAGTVCCAGEYKYGDKVAVKATPDKGFIFVNWTENGNEISTDPQYEFTVTADRDLVANFIDEKTIIFDVTVDVVPEDGGKVEGAGKYSVNSEATLKAIPNDGFRFSGWSANDTKITDSTTYSFTVTDNVKLTATFDKIPVYTVTVTMKPDTTCGIVTGAGSYMDGATAIITAVPNDKYEFTCWTEGEDTVSLEAVYTFMVTGERALVANFAEASIQKYTISVTVNPEEGGKVDGAGVYEENEIVRLVATENKDYKFIGWTENGDTLSKDLEYSFEATADRNLVANFVNTTAINDFVPMNVNVYPNPSNGNFHVNFGEMTGKVVYQLVDVKGSLIATEEMMLDGQSVIGFNYDLPQGTYFVRIVSGQQNVVKPVVIVK